MNRMILPSFRRQQLLFDFAALQHTCPEGIYLSLSSEDPARWTGAYFPRAGPYESAVLRFDISFPPSYPQLPPLITFSDIFHPLCVPSTVYTFSTGALDAAGTVSASDEERLPPGSFSLRHAFPDWFGRQSSLRSSSGSNSKLEGTGNGTDGVWGTPTIGLRAVLDSRSTTLEVLEHLKDAFEDERLLDDVPLRTAGNPSAWHAWQAHRGLANRQIRGRSPGSNKTEKPQSSSTQPGEWNWDGVWASRVHEGIGTTSNEAMLFSNTSRIHFSKMEDEQYDNIKREILSTL